MNYNVRMLGCVGCDINYNLVVGWKSTTQGDLSVPW